MPLGASRLNFLAKKLIEEVVSGVSIGSVSYSGTTDNYSNQSVNTSSADSALKLPSAITVVFVAKPTYNLERLNIMGISDLNNALRNNIFINTTGTIRFYNALASGTSDRTSTETLTNNDWNLVAISKDVSNGNISGWMNGSSITFPSETITGTTFDFDGSATDIGIGTARAGDHNSYMWNGDVAWVGVWPSYTDFTSSQNQARVWDSTESRAIWPGTNGEGYGFGTPIIYHYGNESTVATNQGNIASYSLTEGGSPTNGANYSATDTPASWGDWTTTVGSQIVQPSGTLTDTQRSLSLFNCGDDDTFYVLGADTTGGTPSFSNHNIYRFDRSGSTLTYNSASTFTSGFSMIFTRSNVLDLAEYNKAIYITDNNYKVFTQNTSTKAITVSADDTWNATAYTPTTAQCFVNPDDSTEIVMVENNGSMYFLSFNNGTNDLTTTTTTFLSGTPTQGQGFIIDEGGTAKFAYGYLDGSNWKVYKVNFDGTSGSTTDLGTGGPTLNSFSYKKFEDAASNQCVWAFDNNTTNIPVMAIIWDGSEFRQGSTTNLTHRSADSAGDGINNTRTGFGCTWTREKNYHMITVHLDDDVAPPRQNQVAIIEVNPRTGATTQIGDWVEVALQGETAGNVRKGERATSDAAYMVAMSGDQGAGVSNGCPSLTVLSRD